FACDGACEKAALRGIPILMEAGLSVKIVNMEPYKDPDEFIKALGAEEYQRRIEGSENSFLFEIRMLERQFHLDDPEGKTAFYNEVARRLLGFAEELERNNYIEAVAGKYQIGFENLRKLVYRMGTMEGMAKRDKPLKTFDQGKNRKKEDGMKQSQKLLLTWLASDTRWFHTLRKYITPMDFTEERYRLVARMLFEQYESTGDVNPAQIISFFDGQEEQREIASLFHATIQDLESRADMEKALKETIIRVKRNSMEKRSLSLAPTDLEGLQQLLKDKQRLQELEKLHISIE
ncbi:MAG: DNA primase, partial [Lachnospiraceae bacterium]|nr:DNA primase [Lachnospiraceae bacterium]